ncbi:MAG: hypothetical protein HRU38_25265 [Saccharospirillaceae bacterium]|nr:hypothetical protein [Saccharospirillaceae bacterium]
MRLSFLILLNLLSISAFASSEMLDCLIESNQKIQILFDEDLNDSTLVFDTYSIKGDMSKTEHHYQFEYQKSQKRWPTLLIVNRYNGSLSWEHGSEPFGGDSLDNVFRQGVCKKSAIKKLF